MSRSTTERITYGPLGASFRSERDTLLFRGELERVNLRRVMWIVVTTTCLSLASVGFNLFLVGDRLLEAWQIYDLAGSLLFIGLGIAALKRALPRAISLLLAPAYVIFWISLMMGYYFSALPIFGDTAVYALGVIMPGVLLLLSPRFFLPVLLVNHAVYCLLLLRAGLDANVLLSAYLMGSLAVLISALANAFLFAGKVRSFLQREEILRVEENLRAILENIPFLAWLRDADGRFLALNQPYADQVGLRVGQIVGKTIDEIFPEDEARLYRGEDLTVMKTGRRFYDQQEVLTEGEKRWLEVFKAPVLDRGGQVRGTCGVARDVTERRQIEEHLAAAREDALAADRAKSEFLASMSHEIRTPMNSVLGYARLLEEMSMPPEQREHVETIHHSSKLLLTVINDILDFSKIEAGSIDLMNEPINLRELADTVLRMFRAQAREKGLELKLTLPPTLPVVRGDQHRLQQILVNLLSNALKFTDEGHVGVEVTAESSGPDDVRVAFRVEDTGVGISTDKQDELFQPFRQVDSSPARRHGGTGLGLVIVSRLCGLMGGSIKVYSQLGEGSLFTAEVVLPRDTSAPEIAPPTPTSTGSPLEGLSVLIVEDNASNRRLVELILTRQGVICHCAERGEQALEMIAENSFDVILMDVQMPHMDGMEVTRRVREREQNSGAGRLHIIALTAFATTADRELCIEAGMDDFVSKPITPETLQRALIRFQERVQKA